MNIQFQNLGLEMDSGIEQEYFALYGLIDLDVIEEIEFDPADYLSEKEQP